MNKKIEIISEVAQGYEGKVELANLLTKGSLGSGADSVKFQLIFADELATPDYEHYELFKSLEMKTSVWKNISNIIHQNRKKLYFDIFGTKSLRLAKQVHADGIKISTTEFYNKRLIIKSLSSFDKVFISIGGIPIEDIDSLIFNELADYKEKICLMYGFQSEPTPLNKNNLRKIVSFKYRYPDINIGFMDHSNGSKDDAFLTSLIALGMDISCIEKHITLDHILKIEDYISGISPDNFKKFTNIIRKYEKALGSGNLKLTKIENDYRTKAVKTVVALKKIKKGHIIKLSDVALKRVGNRIDKAKYYNSIEDVINHRLKIDVNKNEAILGEHL